MINGRRTRRATRRVIARGKSRTARSIARFVKPEIASGRPRSSARIPTRATCSGVWKFFGSFVSSIPPRRKNAVRVEPGARIVIWIPDPCHSPVRPSLKEWRNDFDAA